MVRKQGLNGTSVEVNLSPSFRRNCMFIHKASPSHLQHTLLKLVPIYIKYLVVMAECSLVAAGSYFSQTDVGQVTNLTFLHRAFS